MKKQIFSLMLSAAIFTTSPLFAMEPLQPDNEGRSAFATNPLFETDSPQLSEEERSAHLCSACEEKFEAVDNMAGLGTLSILPDERILEILGHLSLKDMLVCSTTSKPLYKICQDSVLLENFAKKYSFSLADDLCMKCSFSTDFPSHLKLFSEWSSDFWNANTITYSIKS